MHGLRHFADELTKIATNLFAVGSTAPITRVGARFTAKSGVGFKVKKPPTPKVKAPNALPKPKNVGVQSGGGGITKVVDVPKTVPNPLRGGTRVR